MTMNFKAFASDESGAGTVDWVMLTAALVGLGLVVMTTVGAAIKDQATNIATDVKAKAEAGTALNTSE